MVESKSDARVPSGKSISAAAQRALDEAAERRRMTDAARRSRKEKEIGGRAGPDPIRYGDWEVKGIISDF
jgi:hypothetical protein